MPSGQAHQETNALRPRGTDSKKQQSWNATWAWLQWRGHARCGGVLWGAPGCSPHGSFGPQKSMSRGLHVTVGSSVSLTPLAKPDPGRPLVQRTPPEFPAAGARAGDQRQWTPSSVQRFSKAQAAARSTASSLGTILLCAQERKDHGKPIGANEQGRGTVLRPRIPFFIAPFRPRRNSSLF